MPREGHLGVGYGPLTPRAAVIQQRQRVNRAITTGFTHRVYRSLSRDHAQQPVTLD